MWEGILSRNDVFVAGLALAASLLFTLSSVFLVLSGPGEINDGLGGWAGFSTIATLIAPVVHWTWITYAITPARKRSTRTLLIALHAVLFIARTIASVYFITTLGSDSQCGEHLRGTCGSVDAADVSSPKASWLFFVLTTAAVTLADLITLALAVSSEYNARSASRDFGEDDDTESLVDGARAPEGSVSGMVSTVVAMYVLLAATVASAIIVVMVLTSSTTLAPDEFRDYFSSWALAIVICLPAAIAFGVILYYYLVVREIALLRARIANDSDVAKIEDMNDVYLFASRGWLWFCVCGLTVAAIVGLALTFVDEDVFCGGSEYCEGGGYGTTLVIVVLVTAVALCCVFGVANSIGTSPTAVAMRYFGKR